MPHRAEISARMGHCGHARPWIRWNGLRCSHTLSCLLDEGADFEGATDRLLGVGLSGSRLLGVGPSWGRLLVRGRLLAAGHLTQPTTSRRRFVLDA